MGPILVIGVVLSGVLIFPLVRLLVMTGDTTEPKSPERRVRKVIGVGIVAAAVWITFLPVSAQYGVDWSGEDVMELGRRCLREEREFNLGAGFARDADYLPQFLRTEPLQTPHGPQAFDLPDELVDSFWDGV